MFIIISYDIANDRIRTKVAKALEAKATRVQYSVFECITTPAEFEKLKKKLGKLIEPEDSIRYYRLCEECLKRAEVAGTGELTRDKTYYIV